MAAIVRRKKNDKKLSNTTKSSISFAILNIQCIQTGGAFDTLLQEYSAWLDAQDTMSSVSLISQLALADFFGAMLMQKAHWYNMDSSF